MSKRNGTAILLVLLIILTNFLMPRPVLAQTQLPDLVIPDVWQDGSQIRYTLSNIGQASAGNANVPVSYYNALYIDGVKVAEDHITTILTPGHQLERSFDYHFELEPPQQTIRVYADSRQNIPESNEQNNYREEVWVAQVQNLPDLIVEKIECGPNNKLAVTLKNIGSGAIPSGWLAVADVYFDKVKKGFFDMAHPTSTLGDGIETPGGSSYYLVAWDITAPVTVTVIADATDDIEESNEQNNVGEAKIEPQTTKLPDLVVSLIKEDTKNQLIGYIIKNIGGGLAKGGHATALIIDGTQVAKDVVNTDIKPGETYESWFNSYKFTGLGTVVVEVYADYYKQLEESNEQNNYLEKTFGGVADTIPPVIISGPTVSQITQNTAIISWETDEDSTSLVRYSAYAGKYENDAEDTNLVKKHSVGLTKLEPATTYHFIVESTDASGNKVTSRDYTFETLSPNDKEKPSLSLKLPATISGLATIGADVQDNTGVAKVIFYLDGKQVFTDYTAPFQWLCDSRKLGEGGHSFGAKAFDVAGNSIEDIRDGTIRNRFPSDESPVKVNIVHPSPSSEVFGFVEIRASVTHDSKADIVHSEVRVDGEVVYQVNYTSLDLSTFRPLKPSTSERKLTVKYMWDSSKLAEGSEPVIEVVARDEFGNEGHAGIRVTKAPELTFTMATSITATARFLTSFDIDRNVTPHGNYFTVELTVTNLGTTSDQRVTNVIIRDVSRGFQVGAFEHNPAFDIVRHEVTVEKHIAELGPGASVTFSYDIVPVLFDPAIDDYTIGIRTEIEYDDSSGNHGTKEQNTPYIPGDYVSLPYPLIPEQVGDAFNTTDYLIVTNPERLFSAYDDDEVNNLLSTIAELAVLKNGVLGYSRTYTDDTTTAHQLKNNIKADGIWGGRLSLAAAVNGYLLLVGETNIIPAWRMYCSGFFMDCTGGYIDISDYPYADTSGDRRPELRVGRIIGQNIRELLTPIQSSIGVAIGRKHYYGLDVLLTTGPEDTWEAFIRSTELGKTILAGKGVSWPIPTFHTDYYTTKHDMLAEALRIKGADAGGANYSPNPPLDTFTTGQLAVWLLDSEDVYWTWWSLEYQHFTDTEGRDHLWAPAYVGDTEINQALRIAERIQNERENRGSDFGYTYTYFDNVVLVLQHRAEDIKALMAGKDIIVFQGHGGPNSWACVLDDWTDTHCPVEPLSFGLSCPIVIAFSCLTANYLDVAGQCIARAFLRNGAAVYIGSTEVSSTADNEDLMEWMFWQGWSRTTSIGDTLYDLRCRIVFESVWWKYLAYEYNLYGDPKFGGG